MWPCGETILEGSVRVVARGAPPEVSGVINGILRSLQNTRKAVVKNRYDLASLEEYLSLLYLFCERVVQPMYDSFVYQGDPPVFSWYVPETDTVHLTTSFRVEMVLTASAYAALLFHQLTDGGQQPAPAIEAYVMGMNVCNDIAMANAKQILVSECVCVTDRSGIPVEWVAPMPAIARPEAIVVMYDLFVATCQIVCIQEMFEDEEYEEEERFRIMESANLTLYDAAMNILRETRNEKYLHKANQALCSACIDHVRANPYGDHGRFVLAHALRLGRAEGIPVDEPVRQMYEDCATDDEALRDIVEHECRNPAGLLEHDARTVDRTFPRARLLGVLTPDRPRLFDGRGPRTFMEYIDQHASQTTQLWLSAIKQFA